MTRGARVGAISVAGLLAATVAQVVDRQSNANELLLLAAALVIGELLVLRLEDGTGLPLSYAVVLVLVMPFAFVPYLITVAGAELVAAFMRLVQRPYRWRVVIYASRLAVAAAGYGAYAATTQLLGEQESVGVVLARLSAAALTIVAVDVTVRWLCRVSLGLGTRGRLAWLALTSSGMLMAIGFHGVDGKGAVGVWGPLLFSTPLLAAWYSFERFDSISRAFRQTIDALAMAPELGGLVREGHAERVARLTVAMGRELDLPDSALQHLRAAALLHHLGQVTLDDQDKVGRSADSAEVAAVTAAMLSEISPLAPAGAIIAGDESDPDARLAAQILRIASAYDDLALGDEQRAGYAVSALRSAPGYVYDARVLDALERVVPAHLVAV